MFNAGYRCERIFETNRKVPLPHSLSLIIFEIPFQNIEKLSYPDIPAHVLHPRVSFQKRSKRVHDTIRT